MSEGEQNKSESRSQGNGGKWDQNWPPFQKPEHREDTGDAEGGKETEKDLNRKLIEHYQANPDELEELCKKSNGGEVDPEELQWYKDHPDKIPQLVEKIREMEGEDGGTAETEDSKEEQEKLKHELLRRIGGDEEFTKWLEETMNLTHGELERMSAEELQELIDKYNAAETEDSKEDQEKLRHELLRRIGGDEEFTRWLEETMNLTHDELEHMSAEELQELIDGYNDGQEEEEGDNDSGREAARNRRGESSGSDGGGIENPFPDSWGGAASESDDSTQAEDASEEDTSAESDDNDSNEAADVASGGAEVDSETPIDDEDMSVEVPYTGRPVRYDSRNTRVYPTDNDIRDAASKVGKAVSDVDIQRLRNALFTWNMMGGDLRRKLLDGRGTVEGRTDEDYGGSEYAQINKNARDLLEEYGLVQSEEEVSAEGDSEGMAA